MNEAARLVADDEPGRLAALRRYNILDTEPEAEFDEIVALITSIFNISSAAINLIDFDRQWSKAAVGDFSERPSSQFNCARSEAFCDHTIRSHDAMMIEDATADPRFANNSLVTGPLGFRSYLGVPLTTPEGYNIGALCVFGTEPRSFTLADKEVLANFAKVVMSQLELRLTARVDGLTGVLNRKAFMTRLDRVVAENGKQPTSLVLLDLDHFKSINDRFGHPAGDSVLMHVTAAMSALLRKADSLGRLGGEEFGILLQDSNVADAEAFTERLRGQFIELAIPEIGGETVTVSAGLAERGTNETRQSWFERADRALYSAKGNGRNRVVAAEAVETA